MLHLDRRIIKFIFVVLGIVITQYSFCQENFLPGYITHTNGDSTKGFVDFRNREKNPDQIYFKDDLSSKKFIYTPAMISGFGVEGEMYISAIVQTEVSPSDLRNLQSDAKLQIVLDTVFLQTIVRGSKGLYYLKNSNNNKNFYINQDKAFDLLVYKKYLRKQGQKDAVAENKKYIGQLGIYLKNCEAVQSKLKHIEYSQKSLTNLFQAYYECSKTDIVFQKERDRISTEVGLVAGVSLNALKFKSDRFVYLANAEFSRSYNFTAGLSLDLIFPRNQKKWSAYNELLYTSFDIEGYHEDFKDENAYSITYTEFAYSYLKINNMLRFTYPIGNVSLYINAGLTNGLAVREKNYKRDVLKLYSTERVKEGKALDSTSKYALGYIVGLGGKVYKFKLELRYEKGNGMSEYATIGSSTISYYLFLGYRL